MKGKCKKGKILVDGKCTKSFKLAEDKEKAIQKKFEREVVKKWGSKPKGFKI